MFSKQTARVLTAATCFGIIGATTRGESPYQIEWSRGVVFNSHGTIALMDDAIYLTGSAPSPGTIRADAAVARYSTTGELVWLRQQGVAARSEISSGVAADSLGNVYIAGREGPFPEDGYVSKYDQGGDLLWTRPISTSASDECIGVSTDATGNVYVVGQTQGPLGGPVIGTQDGFVVKYDPTGDWQWSRQFGTTVQDDVTGIATDSSGNSYALSFAGIDIVSPAIYHDILLTKHDVNGALQWVARFGEPGQSEFAGSVAIDDQENVLVTGSTYGYGFLVKFDPTGSQLWAQTMENALYGSIGVDAGGNIYIGGSTGPPLGAQTPFLVKYDSGGSLLWSGKVPLGTTDSIEEIAVSEVGEVYAKYRDNFPPGGPSPLFTLAKLIAIPEPSGWLLAALTAAAFSVANCPRRRKK